MRSNARARRRRHAVARTVAAVVLVALGTGLAPAPVMADETPTTTDTTSTANSSTAGTSDGGAEGSVDGGTVTRPAPVAVSPTLVEVVGAANQANVVLGGVGVGGGSVRILTDELSVVGDALDIVIEFLTSEGELPEVDLGPFVNIDELMATAEELRRQIDEMLPNKGDVIDLANATVDDAEDAAQKLGPGLQALVDGLSARAWALYADAVRALPTAEEVLALAREIEAYVREVADGAGQQAAERAQMLLVQVGAVAAYLTDEAHQRTAKTALTTLLLTLADNVNPLPDALAPTTEAGVNAAGELASWADELVRQGAEGPGPFYTEDTASDEAPPAPDDAPLVDSVVVGDEAITVEQPVAVTPAVSATSDIGVVDADLVPSGADHCGRAPGRLCAPPVRSGGGRVIHRPIVRVALVGSWWHGVTGTDLRAGLDNMFGGMSGSGYQNILRQYWDHPGGYIGPDVAYQGAHILEGDPPAVVSQTRVASYAVRASRERAGWRTSPSVVWVVALPPSSVADYAGGAETKCGYQSHARSGTETFVIAEVDYPRADCTFFAGGVRGNFTATTVHEYIGAVTNPEGAGWYDDMGQHLPDLCEERYFRGPGGEWVQQVWSNADNGCVSSFTPRFSYRVTRVALPAGDAGPGSAYTRGHSYPGASVIVVNTGNMPWLSFGGKKTYLTTADNRCSPFAGTYDPGGWVNCRQIALPLSTNRVEVGGSVTFGFPLKPDGSLFDDDRDRSETFRPIAGTTWMTNTGSTSAHLSGIDIQEFQAESVGVPTMGYFAVGQPGTDTKVTITLRNTGTAYWYPREVMYIGSDGASPFAATSWPRGPGGCRNCRAHRFDKLTPPGGTYTFDLTLHLPAADKALMKEASFFPYADVRRVADGGIAPKKLGGARIRVHVVMLPKPVAAHDVAGYGFASGDSGTAPVDESGFSCLAAAGVDATRTRIASCRATVTTAAGYAYTYDAPAAAMDGPLAWTGTLWTGYTPAAGDTISVCWTAESMFLDGTEDTHSGCSG